MVYIHDGILISHKKKEWNNVICSNMDGPKDCHTEWSKSDRKGEISYDVSYMWNLKRRDKNELTCKVERERINLWLLGERYREGTFKEFRVDMYILLYLKWITHKNLLYSVWNSAQCYVVAWMGGGLGGEWIHMYVWLCCSPETITTLLITYNSIQNKKLK